jgi:2-oxoisovalerate dehydrogenase E1 component
LGSARRTHRLLLVSDAVLRGSPFNAVAVTIGRLVFGELAAPIVVLGAPDHIAPSAELEDRYYPQVEDILDVIGDELLPLDGYRPRAPSRRDRILAASRRGA